MSEYVIMDADSFGWGSKGWILRNALEHAPVEHKTLTLQSLVTFLEANEEHPIAVRVLDIIAQGTLTGEYRPTIHVHTDIPGYPSAPEPATAPVEDAVVDDSGYPEHDDPRNPLTKISEEEIEKFIREQKYILGEDAADPMEDWKIDE